MSGVIKKFESGVDRLYEKVDAFYHKYHIIVDVVFFAALVYFVSMALLIDAVTEVRNVLSMKVIRESVMILDNWILLPILAVLALMFDIKDKRIRLTAFFSLFLLLLYQGLADKQIIAIIPHTNTHYFGAGCLVVAAAGQKWNRIGWTYVITCSLCMVVLTVLSLVGVIPDLVFSLELGGRHSLGMHYPLNWAAHWFSVALVYCMLKKGILHIIDYLVLVVLLLVSLFACRAKTSSILYFLLIVCTGVRQLMLWKKPEIIQKIKGWADKIKLNKVLIFSFWIMAAVMIFLTICYVPPISSFLEKVPGIGTLNSRLRMGRIGLVQYFPSKFGVNYPTSTWIGTTYSDHYFFIDCSYIMILLRAGVIVFTIMMLDLLWVPYRLLHAKERYSLSILFLFAVICAMEHHILDLSVDPFLLLSFSMIGTQTASKALIDFLKPIEDCFLKNNAREKEEKDY